MFEDRTQAGLQLAQKLAKYSNNDVIVYALPRGGVVIGSEVARVLHAPLDLIITRKIGHPLQSEFAIGAVDDQGNSIFNQEELLDVDHIWLEQEIKKQVTEANRRKKLYSQDSPSLSADRKITIIVDDGIATGLTMQAAILSLKKKYQLQKIIIAVPVIPTDTYAKLKTQVDEIITLLIPRFFSGSIGSYYRNFPQLNDQEVIDLLKK